MMSVIEYLSLKIGTGSIFCEQVKKKGMVRVYFSKRKYGIVRVEQKSRLMITWHQKWMWNMDRRMCHKRLACQLSSIHDRKEWRVLKGVKDSSKLMEQSFIFHQATQNRSSGTAAGDSSCTGSLDCLALWNSSYMICSSRKRVDKIFSPSPVVMVLGLPLSQCEEKTQRRKSVSIK